MSPSPQTVRKADIDAFVLAGGQSSRMGRDKALIQLAGKPLIQHALEILQAAGLDPRIAGGTPGLSAFAPVIPDDPEQTGLGPLSGICSVFPKSAARYILFFPVDLPLIPATLISYLIRHASTVESVVTLVSVAGFLQTFPVVIDRRAAPALQASLGSKDRKCITAFQSAANAVSRQPSILPLEILLQAEQVPVNSFPPSRWFLNINTPHDLAQAGSVHMAQAVIP